MPGALTGAGGVATAPRLFVELIGLAHPTLDESTPLIDGDLIRPVRIKSLGCGGFCEV